MERSRQNFRHSNSRVWHCYCDHAHLPLSTLAVPSRAPLPGTFCIAKQRATNVWTNPIRVGANSQSFIDVDQLVAASLEPYENRTGCHKKGKPFQRTRNGEAKDLAHWSD